MSETMKHLSWDQLIDYWLDDADATTTEAADRHLMHCDACGGRLDAVMALARGVREAFVRGQVAAVLSTPFTERLKAGGLRLREYHLPHNGSVNCTVAPQDDLLIGHMQVPLAGVTRVDALLQLSLNPGQEQRLADLPFDTRAGEVVLVPRVQAVRGLPDNVLHVRLMAVEDHGEREIGRYAFVHRAWTGGAP